MVIVFGVVEVHHADTFHLLQPVSQFFRLLISHIADHDTGSAVCEKLFLHQVQSLPGLRGIRQIGCQVIVDLYPVHGGNAEENQHDKNQIKSFPLIHDQGGQLHHKRFVFLFLFHRTSHILPIFRHVIDKPVF